MAWISDILREWIIDNKSELDSSYFRASSMGYCYRRQVYERKNTEPSNPSDNHLLITFQVGHLVHEFLQNVLKEKCEVLAMEDEIYDDHGFAGHTDGLVKCNGETILLDFKTISKWGFDRLKKVKRTHAMQITWYWMQYSQKHKIDKVQVIYINKDMSRTIEFKVYDVDVDKYLPYVKRDINTLKLYLESDKLPPKIPQEEWQCAYCPFLQKCKPDMDLIKEYFNKKSDTNGDD